MLEGRALRRLLRASDTRELSQAVANDRLEGIVLDERGERTRLERLRRTAMEDLALGQVIQQSLVPVSFARGDLAVAVRHIPCALVGGDYLQASFSRAGLLYLCVGDVSGHGVAAALVVSRMHAHVQSMILQDVGPAEFLESLNHAALRIFQQTSMFMTFAVIRIDLTARTIEHSTAGHPAPYLLRAGGVLEELATANRALGVGPNALHVEAAVGRTDYAPGDAILLLSDGLFETRGGPAHRVWGEDAIKENFVRLRRCAPDYIVDEILRSAGEFRRGDDFEDDVSLLVARMGVVPAGVSSGQRSPPDPASGGSRPRSPGRLAKESADTLGLL